MTTTEPSVNNPAASAKEVPATAITPATWVVTARHRSTAAIKPAQPWGTWHVRRPGDAFTACGLPAVGWPLFWHLAHAGAGARRCRECQEVVYSEVAVLRTQHNVHTKSGIGGDRKVPAVIERDLPGGVQADVSAVQKVGHHVDGASHS